MPGAVLQVLRGHGSIVITATSSFVVSGTIQGENGSPGLPPTNIELRSPEIRVAGKVVGGNGADGANVTDDESGTPANSATAVAESGQPGASITLKRWSGWGLHHPEDYWWIQHHYCEGWGADQGW